ncbi:GvpL/GvpF family gas vesicle protein [bacterium]|nr:GvpL/GvpF family gas vesicle protein [bacterium]
MKAGRLYIYCIIELNESKWGQKKRNGEEFSFRAIGIDKEEVTTVSFNDIAAVVSRTQIDQFDEDGEEALTQYVTRHQQVIKFVMQTHPVIPMKFGTVAEDQNELLEMLDRVYIQFKAAFNKLRDKIELAVQVFLDEQVALQEIVAINKEIQRLMAQLPHDDLQANITIGKVVHDVVSQKREAVIIDIRDYLLPHAADFASNKLLTENMIMNGAFLVYKQEETEFDDKVNEISDKYNGNLQFKYIGPMSPYSFVNIELTMPKFERKPAFQKSKPPIGN